MAQHDGDGGKGIYKLEGFDKNLSPRSACDAVVNVVPKKKRPFRLSMKVFFVLEKKRSFIPKVCSAHAPAPSCLIGVVWPHACLPSTRISNCTWTESPHAGPF